MVEKNKAVSLLVLAGICVSLSLIVRLGTSIFLPALPLMESELLMSPRELSLSISVYWVVFAFSALFFGPIADLKGRKIILLLSCFTYLVGSLICGFALGEFTFILGRLIQSIGGSAIPIIIISSIKDQTKESEFLSLVGWISTIASLGPLAAPLLGGFLTEHFSWRACFYFLAVASGIVWLLAAWKFPKTPPKMKEKSFAGKTLLKDYLAILRQRKFYTIVLANASCFLLQGLYLTVAPFLFIEDLRLSSKSFGATSIIVIVGLLLGKFIASFFAKKSGPRIAYLVGSSLTFLGGLMMLAILMTGLINVVSFLTATFVFCMGFGGVSPLTLHAISNNFRMQVSNVVALNNALSLCAAALSAYIAGFLMSLEISNVQILAYGASVIGLACLVFAWLAKTHFANQMD